MSDSEYLFSTKTFNKTKMTNPIKIRWHSRAGQGAVSAADFLATALATLGYKAQSFPDFGAEKRGAPVVVFNRASKTDELLDDPAQIINANIIILLDPTLIGAELEHEDILKNLSQDGTLLINTTKTEKSKFNNLFQGQIHHIEASKIAMSTLGKNLPNIAIIGALTKTLNLPKQKIQKTLKTYLEKFFNKKTVNQNIESFKQGYEQVKKVE